MIIFRKMIMITFENDHDVSTYFHTSRVQHRQKNHDALRKIIMIIPVFQPSGHTMFAKNNHDYVRRLIMIPPHISTHPGCRIARKDHDSLSENDHDSPAFQPSKHTIFREIIMIILRIIVMIPHIFPHIPGAKPSGKS